MQFQPKTEQELQTMNLLDKGIYDFHIANASEAVSRSGNDMIKLVVKVWDTQGCERTIFDYLLNNYKLKHFCDVSGMENKYEEGKLTAEDCVGKCGKAMIVIQKDKTGQYGDKNSISDYIKQEEKPKEDPFFDDDIPFA